MSARAETLQRIDGALADLASIKASLGASRHGERLTVDRTELASRFEAIADASTGSHRFSAVQELATLAGRVAATGEVEAVEHAADVLSLLLNDLGHQLFGCRGADVVPAATALRERLERELLAAHR